MTPNLVPFSLNAAAAAIARRCIADDSLRISSTNIAGATVLDFGVTAAGGLHAGIELAHVCLSGLGRVAVESGSLDGRQWPQVTVQTDWPVAACLLSQYAGWQIAVGKFFAMGSGPMRAAASIESLFKEFRFRRNDQRTDMIVGVLESGRLPDENVVAWLCEKLDVSPDRLTLCVAPTASLAGTLQVVARSVETTLHKLHELKFDVSRITSGHGTAPLPPVAADDLVAIGRTNDAILYGGSVTLWMTGDDESIAAIGPQVPASSSAAYGRPFLKLFEEADRDFYKIDPMLFSPAEVTICNLTTGRVQRFGHVDAQVLKVSFGV